MSEAPIIATWEGDAFRPARRFQKACDQRFTIGEQYRFDPEEERSIASHNHYFAMINEAWRNLPEDMTERFPTPERLRKWALIKCGYHDERSLVCASKAEALRVAAFVRGMDDYAVVTVSEAVVTSYMAKSQNMRAMGKEAFQASKDAVLAFLAEMLDVTPAQLQHASAA